jgi:CheY-like chemotaxis protein
VKSLRFGPRLMISFGVVLLLIFVFGVRAYQYVDRLAGITRDLYLHPIAVRSASKSIQIDVLKARDTVWKMVYLRDKSKLGQSVVEIRKLEDQVSQNFSLVNENFLGDKREVREAQTSFNRWLEIVDSEIRLMEENQWEKTEEVINRTGTPAVSQLDSDLKDIVDFAEKKSESFYAQSIQIHQQVVTELVLIWAGIFVCSFIIGYAITRSITKPLARLMQVAADVASGAKVPLQKTERSDEIGDLIRSFDDIIRSNDLLVSQAQAISTGDFSRDVQIRSAQDDLGLALQQMTVDLRKARRGSDYQDWLKSGQNKLNESLSGDQEISILARKAIYFLANYLGAQMGAIYLYSAEKGELILQGSYALTLRQGLDTGIKLGQGLVGQAGRDREVISVSNLPEDYARITSATGDAWPRNVIVAPVVHEDQLVGVLELASVAEFSAEALEFLQLVRSHIAITLQSAQSREKMKLLLAKTQEQSEELQLQQEELQQINEELQSQQEELRQTNEELQEQTSQLEVQKQSIEEKNRLLEQTRGLIEEKAAALEVASRYKSEFLANMSHELRTPLNSILLLSKMLAENKGGATLSDKQMEFARTIHDSGADLLTLINEILDLSKIEAGKMELSPDSFPIRDVMGSLNRLFQPVAKEKGLDWEFYVGAGLPDQVYTDRLRLEQILRNLIGNAVKFTALGWVRLRARRPLAGEILPASSLLPGETVVWSVEDTGEGIPADKQSLIFEAFKQADGTTSRKHGGSGLGLTIVRQLARLLGGEVTLSSAAGKGSTFNLFLPESFKGISASARHLPQGAKIPAPAVPSQAETRPTVPEPMQEIEQIYDDRRTLSAGDKSLLIIEDDPKFAKILADLARERGFKILVAESGETGLHFADYYKPCAIILDLGLPGMNGWDVLTRFKENGETRHIPVHIVSAMDKTIDALKLGAVGYLAKPVSMGGLDQAFERLERFINRKVKNLLVVDDQPIQRKAIAEYLQHSDLCILEAANGEEAYRCLQSTPVDCMILDIGLPDVSGTTLLKRIRDDSTIAAVPIIVYTGRDLTPEEESIVHQYAEATVIKGVRSIEKLLDDTSLFLHRVEHDLPEDKRKIIRMLHDQEAIFKNRKVLIVDDDMRNVYAVSNVLENKGMTVVAARNGRDALARLKDSPDVDLILMDIMMPEMDGYETMREIKKMPQFRKLPMIALTAKAMRGDRAKCIEAGACDYLSKPVETEKLFSLLRVWLYR